MRTLVVPVIGQHLSEVEVVIRPYRIEMADAISIHKRALILVLRYHTVSIAEVTIAVALLNITTIINGACSIYVCNTRRTVDSIILYIVHCRWLRQCAVGIDSVERMRLTSTGLRVVISLIEVEAVQVVCHRTVIEGSLRHRTCQAVSVIRGAVGKSLGIVAVDDLFALSCRVAKDSLDTCWEAAGSTGVDPAVLDITITGVGNTCGGE